MPAGLLTCKPEPAVPETINDATTAQFIVDLADSGADCRGKLASVKRWSDDIGKGGATEKPPSLRRP